MSVLAPWRRELQALIPRGFLRRDQGEGLFVSDFPRHGNAEAVAAALAASGYRVQIRDGIAYLDGTAQKYRDFFAALPCPSVSPREDTLAAFALARRLIRADVPLEEQPLKDMTAILKLLDAGEILRAAENLAVYAALRQRRHEPLPAAAGKLLFCALAEREGGSILC